MKSYKETCKNITDANGVERYYCKSNGKTIRVSRDEYKDMSDNNLTLDEIIKKRKAGLTIEDKMSLMNQLNYNLGIVD